MIIISLPSDSSLKPSANAEGFSSPLAPYPKPAFSQYPFQFLRSSYKTKKTSYHNVTCNRSSLFAGQQPKLPTDGVAPLAMRCLSNKEFN